MHAARLEQCPGRSSWHISCISRSSSSRSSTPAGWGGRQRGPESPGTRPQPCTGSGKAPGSGHKGYLVLGRVSVLLPRALGSVLAVSVETSLSTPQFCPLPLPGGYRKLLYYLNEGHYGIFRVCLRELVSRTPMVVKVRAPWCGSGTESTELSPLPWEAGVPPRGGEVQGLRLQLALQIVLPRARARVYTGVPVCICVCTSFVCEHADLHLCGWVCGQVCGSVWVCVPFVCLWAPTWSLCMHCVRVFSRILERWRCRRPRKQRFFNIASQ